jgi:hypothetical protein
MKGIKVEKNLEIFCFPFGERRNWSFSPSNHWLAATNSGVLFGAACAITRPD